MPELTKVYKFIQQRFSKYNRSFIIIFDEKHERRHFSSTNVESAAAIFFKIFEARLKDGFWYDFDNRQVLSDITAIHSIDKMKAGMLAYQFLSARSDKHAEYEMFTDVPDYTEAVA